MKRFLILQLVIHSSNKIPSSKNKKRVYQKMKNNYAQIKRQNKSVINLDSKFVFGVLLIQHKNKNVGLYLNSRFVNLRRHRMNVKVLRTFVNGISSRKQIHILYQELVMIQHFIKLTNITPLFLPNWQMHS